MTKLQPLVGHLNHPFQIILSAKQVCRCLQGVLQTHPLAVASLPCITKHVTPCGNYFL